MPSGVSEQPAAIAPAPAHAEALTINEAAETSGWSARMLRYIESAGLIEPQRSAAGYRLYGAPELQRLRTLRELLNEHQLEISDIGFAARLRSDEPLSRAIDDWFGRRAERPAGVDSGDWLAWEQEKHKRLLEGPGSDTP